MKRQCSKGYSCGSSCIQVSKACLKEFPEGVSVTLDSRIPQYNKKEPPAPAKEKSKYKTKDSFEKITPTDGELTSLVKSPLRTQRESFEGGLTRYNVFEVMKRETSDLMKSLEGGLDKEAYNLLKNNWNGKMFEVMWGVMSTDNSDDPKEKLRAALDAKKTWNEKVLPALPEGSLLYNSPLGGPDGTRDRLYRKGGFGRVQRDTAQYAMIIGGKLVPVEFDEPNPRYFMIDPSREKNWEFKEKTKVTKEDFLTMAKEMGIPPSDLDEEEINLMLEEANSFYQSKR